MRRLHLRLGTLLAIAIASVALIGTTTAAQAAGTITFCNTGAGTFAVLGSGLPASTTVIVWQGPVFNANSVAVATDAGGNVRVEFPLGSASSVEITDANYNTLAGPTTVPASLPTCANGVGPADPAHSLISASPTSVAANGTSAATITVQARDANGNNLVTGGSTVALASSLGAISPVQDNGDGTYTATLTSTAPGTATVTGVMNGQAISSSVQVTFTPVGGGPAPGPTTADQCKYGQSPDAGWRQWTGAPFNFRNQGDCVSYVQHLKK